MNSKTKEVNVMDYLNSADHSGSGASKSTSQSTKKTNEGWIEEEEVGGIFDVEKGTKVSKTKSGKKKVETKGWGQEPEVPEKQEPVPEAQPIDTKKPKIFVKPTHDSKPVANVSVNEGDFPVIGEEVKPSSKQTVETPQQPQNSTGPRKFVNNKKNNQGESFAPIDPTSAKEPEPQPAKIIVGEKFGQKPAVTEEAPADGKFKFSEGPKKFSSNKSGSQKEETKTEQDKLREQKEREIEERLRKQKEEEQARRNKIEQSKKNSTPQKQEPEPEQTEDSEWKTTTHEHKKAERKEEVKHDGPHHDYKNSKKTPKNSQNEQVTPTAEPKENKEQKETKEEDSTKAKEKIQINSELSNKDWGEGGIIKKTKKKL